MPMHYLFFNNNISSTADHASPYIYSYKSDFPPEKGYSMKGNEKPTVCSVEIGNGTQLGII